MCQVYLDSVGVRGFLCQYNILHYCSGISVFYLGGGSEIVWESLYFVESISYLFRYSEPGFFKLLKTFLPLV